MPFDCEALERARALGLIAPSPDSPLVQDQNHDFPNGRGVTAPAPAAPGLQPDPGQAKVFGD